LEPLEAVSLDPLEADGALAFLAALGALTAETGAATGTGTMIGTATGTATGTVIGTATGTALPPAGAVVCAEATARRATKEQRDLNILIFGM